MSTTDPIGDAITWSLERELAHAQEEIALLRVSLGDVRDELTALQARHAREVQGLHHRTEQVEARSRKGLQRLEALLEKRTALWGERVEQLRLDRQLATGLRRLGRRGTPRR